MITSFVRGGFVLRGATLLVGESSLSLNTLAGDAEQEILALLLYTRQIYLQRATFVVALVIVVVFE